MMEKKIIKNRWQLEQKIGQGGFGEIYKAFDLEIMKKVAIKTENASTRRKALSLEIAIFKELQGSPYIANFIHWGKTEEFTYLVMELLGRNISTYRKGLGLFSLKTTILLGIEMLRAIEYIHRKGFIHRDIKASNFCMNPNFASIRGNSSTSIPSGGTDSFYLPTRSIVIIDFGLSKSYRNQDGTLKSQRENVGFRGTSRYASINSHRGIDLSRRDDLESLWYVLIEFLTGRLPWYNLKDKDEILKLKEEFRGEKLCEGLPEEFLEFYNEIDKLGFYDTPNYERLLQILRRLYKKKKYHLQPNKLDWEVIDSHSSTSTGIFRGSSGSSKRPLEVSTNLAITGSVVNPRDQKTRIQPRTDIKRDEPDDTSSTSSTNNSTTELAKNKKNRLEFYGDPSLGKKYSEKVLAPDNTSVRFYYFYGSENMETEPLDSNADEQNEFEKMMNAIQLNYDKESSVKEPACKCQTF